MKKFKFKTQESIIKGIEERPIKKGFNWDRLIYFTTLVIILVSFGSYFISRQIKVSAESEIIMDKFNVTFTNDVIVTEYFVEEGDSVRPGDSLFTYRLNLYDMDGGGGAYAAITGDRSYSRETENWLTREKLSTLKNIDLKTLDLREIERKIKSRQGEMDRIRQQVFLELDPPSKLRTAEEDLSKLISDKDKINEELNYLRNYLSITLARIDELRSQIPDISMAELAGGFGNGGSGGRRDDDFVYLAPKEGMVSQIYARSDEVCYKQNLVLDIIEFQGIHILSYFKQEDLKYITTGDIVDIQFPDGSKSKGIIDKLYIKTTNMPDRLYDQGSTIERRIKAVVVPLNVRESSNWYEFYKINVTVSKPKYF